MINENLLNLEALSRAHLFANIPWYLFKNFRRDESVRQLAVSVSPADLVDAVREFSSKRTFKDITIAYGALVALSFHDADKIKGALPRLGEVRNLEWLDEIVKYIIDSQAGTGSKSLATKPTIIVREEGRRSSRVDQVYAASELILL